VSRGQLGRALRDSGRLATITGDPPPAGRGVAVTSIVVVPDGPRLRTLTRLLGQGAISITVGGWYPLEQAGQALAQARQGMHGEALVIRPGVQDGTGPGTGALAAPAQGGPR
jgi:hypothetical protein